MDQTLQGRDRAVVDAYKAGMHYRKVAETFGISKSRVNQIIQRDAGESIRKRGYPALSREVRECANPDCGGTFRVIETSKRRYCSTGCGHRMSLAMVDALVADYASGMTFHQVALRHGLSPMAVYRNVRAANPSVVRRRGRISISRPGAN